jgi:hypothetical protein
LIHEISRLPPQSYKDDNKFGAFSHLAERVGASHLLRVVGNEEANGVRHDFHATRVDHDFGTFACTINPFYFVFLKVIIGVAT